MFTPDNEHGIQKKRVAEKIQEFFDRFFTLWHWELNLCNH
jgi:hypothetical protein